MTMPFSFAMLRRHAFVLVALAFYLSSSVLAFAAQAATARIEEGSKVLAAGESAEFRITPRTEVSADLSVSCDVSSGGSASIMFDGEHYIPLSEPSVGEVLTFSAGETRHFDLVGSVEKNEGDAYIAFSFTGAPTAMCFPGMDCATGAGASAKNVKVVCRNAN